jgi:hypothetical protein
MIFMVSLPKMSTTFTAILRLLGAHSRSRSGAGSGDCSVTAPAPAQRSLDNVRDHPWRRRS